MSRSSYPFNRVPAVGEAVDPDDLTRQLRITELTPEDQTFTIPVGTLAGHAVDYRVIERIELPSTTTLYEFETTLGHYIFQGFIYHGCRFATPPFPGGVYCVLEWYLVPRGLDWTTSIKYRIDYDFSEELAGIPWIFSFDRSDITWETTDLVDPLDLIEVGYCYANPLPTLPHTFKLTNLYWVWSDLNL